MSKILTGWNWLLIPVGLVVATGAFDYFYSSRNSPKIFKTHDRYLDDARDRLQRHGYECPAAKRTAHCRYQHTVIEQISCGPDDRTRRIDIDMIYSLNLLNNNINQWEDDPDTCPEEWE